MTLGTGWRSLANLLKAEARLFSPKAAENLASFFDCIGELEAREGHPLILDAGPRTDFPTLYRARVFQSDDKLKAALTRPDIHLGSPPVPSAAAGRMNARGILAFYGANNQKVAVAEVRPPVGSRIAVAQFEIIRTLRLLDVTALGDVRITEGLADCGLAGRMEGAVFLRLLRSRLTRPAMPDDDGSEYLATEAMVHFLATEVSAPIDGIIFPSVQAVGDAFNIVLFQGAARVEPVNVPERAEISASTGRWAEDGWVDDYEVLEKVPSTQGDVDNNEQEPTCPAVTTAKAAPAAPRDANWRDYSLRIMPESVRVHRVRSVEFATDKFAVKRRRQEKHGSIDI